MDKEKIVCDAIFGFITLKPYIISIVDTPEFQRMRNISQLGCSSFVYPTANHSRFEHSIGTYHLASRIVTKLRKQLLEENEEEIISERDIMCVEIAALCHDIGHGPFSHLWEHGVLKTFCPDTFISHEKRFAEIWGLLRRNERVSKMIENFKITEAEENLIINLVKGKTVENKEILGCIVNNSESGMDVDKWDYLARDSTYLGHASTNFRTDIDRMLHMVRAIKDGDEKWKICFRDTETLNILRVFQLRHYMYQTSYQHRTTIAIDSMMVDGVEECFEKGILKRNEIENVEWILANTDAIFWSNFNKIPTFRKILERNLYKLIFEAVNYKVIANPKNEVIQNFKNRNIEMKSMRFEYVEFKLGNKDVNPLFKIPFYNNSNKTKLFKLKEESLPSYLNMNCNESRIMVFYVTSNEKNEQENGEDIKSLKQSLTDYFNSKNHWIIQNLK